MLPLFRAASAIWWRFYRNGPYVAPKLIFRIAIVTGSSNAHGTTHAEDGAILQRRAGRIRE
jgi:hypothetical protein